MRKWAAANLREIRDDRSLSLYGSALALVNLVVAVFWLRSEPIGLILAPGNPPVCWPFFPDCHNARVLSPATTELIVRLLGALAIVNVWLFAVGKNVKSAFWLLAFLTALKFTLIAQDFRLIHNQHYMAGWATFCYLFVPHKRLVLKLLIVTFYVWAGMLKLNDDWLSGAALHGRHPLGLPATLVPASCAYVVVLEIVLVWGVLSRRVLISGHRGCSSLSSTSAHFGL